MASVAKRVLICTPGPAHLDFLQVTLVKAEIDEDAMEHRTLKPQNDTDDTQKENKAAKLAPKTTSVKICVHLWLIPGILRVYCLGG